MTDSINRTQQHVITKVQMAGGTLLGLDAKNRPAVECMTGIPQQLRRWAIKRDGDPIDIVEPVCTEWVN